MRGDTVPTPWHFESESLRVRKFIVGPVENNVYIVTDNATSQALIIDAAFDEDRIIAETRDVQPIAILTTHGHWDHVGAAAAVASRLSIPFRIHPNDATQAGIEGFRPLADNEVISFGTSSVEAIHTPGHTPGSTCFATHGLLFSGDTLFPGGPGATRFPGSSFPHIMESLRTRLFVLDDETIVLPGHGLDTTLGTERPFLDEWESRGW